MKGIEFILLAVGAILGVYIRYKITSPIDIRNNRFKCVNSKYHRKFYPGYLFSFISQLEFRPKVFLSNSNRILWFSHYHVFIRSRKYSTNRKQTNSKHDDQYYSKCRLFLFGSVWWKNLNNSITTIVVL